MIYYDYRSYFQTIIDNQELIISNNSDIIKFLSVLVFLFVCFFMYYLIRKMIINK